MAVRKGVWIIVFVFVRVLCVLFQCFDFTAYSKVNTTKESRFRCWFAAGNENASSLKRSIHRTWKLNIIVGRAMVKST